MRTEHRYNQRAYERTRGLPPLPLRGREAVVLASAAEAAEVHPQVELVEENLHIRVRLCECLYPARRLPLAYRP